MKGKMPKKVQERIKSQAKKFQKILESARARDINESDTVIIVNDILSDMFGFDKYSEITTEFAIRGTYCDLAIKSGDKIFYLIEVKAIGMDLKDNHLRQTVDYAANQGIDWSVLTNGCDWHIYKILFQKPIDYEEIFRFNLLDFNPRNTDLIYQLYLLSKEGIKKDAIDEYHHQVQVANRYTIGALITCDPVVRVVLREVRKIGKGIKISDEYIRDIIKNEVLKREVVEGERATNARKLVGRFMAAEARKKVKKTHPANKNSDISKPASENEPLQTNLNAEDQESFSRGNYEYIEAIGKKPASDL
ncbi:MAG: type I restriction enzyme HsdR N-terminal domain-containing protein [Desulfarculaceae bacterium]|jgi:hypothetical protein